MTHDDAGRLDIKRIMEMLPHRYPFLLVDRVTSFEVGSKLEAYKNVSYNEPFFQGHFPGLPVMPGVLILEAMAQAGGLLLSAGDPECLNGKVFMFTGIDKVRFRRPVRPGDRLDLILQDLRSKMRISKMNGTALVDGQVVAEASLSAAVVDREELE